MVLIEFAYNLRKLIFSFFPAPHENEAEIIFLVSTGAIDAVLRRRQQDVRIAVNEE